MDRHQATDLAVYSGFTTPIHAVNTVTAPTTPGVRFTSMADGVIVGQGGIRHVINDTGPAVDASQANHLYGMVGVRKLASYPTP